MTRTIWLTLILLSFFTVNAFAEPGGTVCTITVNSDDEAKAFRRGLPAGKWNFVELVEQGRKDWLQSACSKKIKCDILIISGHFANTSFYADTSAAEQQRGQFHTGKTEKLEVDELERVACSASCPGLISQLKEVYLFGCNTLNNQSMNYVANGFEQNRDRMRRIFFGVPSLNGFSKEAPLGPSAGAAISSYFRSAMNGEVGSGRLNNGIVRNLAKNNMISIRGMEASDRDYGYRQQVCNFFDERLALAEKLRFTSEVLNRDITQVRIFFDHIENFLGKVAAADAAKVAVLAEARERFMKEARERAHPALRIRMTKLAFKLGWFTAEGFHQEILRMADEMVRNGSVTYAEINGFCELNAKGEFSSAANQIKAGGSVPAAAALACLGNREAQGLMVRYLGDSRKESAPIISAYFKNRPIESEADMRALAAAIPGFQSADAQVTALENLARSRVADQQTLQLLMDFYPRARTKAVQDAIAGVFLRADLKDFDTAALAHVIGKSNLDNQQSAVIKMLLFRIRAPAK